MRIGIFGGSFNPPHKMHEDIANFFINKKLLDRIVFVPTGSKYKYKTNLVSDIDRYNMVKIITDKYDYLDVSNYELKDEVVYTYQTLDYFKEENPDDEIYFICGLDNLSYIDKWMEAEHILNNYNILVIRRNTDDLDEVLTRLDKYKDHIHVVDMESRDVSSTFIRDELNSGNESKYLDDGVYAYIKSRKLYEE